MTKTSTLLANHLLFAAIHLWREAEDAAAQSCLQHSTGCTQSLPAEWSHLDPQLVFPDTLLLGFEIFVKISDRMNLRNTTCEVSREGRII